MQIRAKILEVYENVTVMGGLRTKIFAQVVRSMGKFKNGYQTQKFFTPEKFKRNKDGGTDYPKTWTRYLKGVGHPDESKLRVAEFNFPGSRKWFDMPFWELIDTDALTHKKLNNLIINFEGADDLLEHISTEGSTLTNIILATTNLIDRVEKIMSYEATDVVSALTLLTLNSDQLNNSNKKMFLVKSLFDYVENCLVVFGDDIEFTEIFDLCFERFFSRKNDIRVFEKKCLGTSICGKKERMLEQIRIKREVIKLDIDIRVENIFPNPFVILYKYDKLNDSNKQRIYQLFKSSENKFTFEIGKFLLSIYRR